MYTLKEVAKFINAQLIGSNITITSIATLKLATAKQLSFITNNKYKKDLVTTSAGAVIIDKKFIDICPTNCLVVDNTSLAFAIISNYFKKQNASSKIKTKHFISKKSKIGNNYIIGTNSIIEDNVTIGDNAYLYPNVTILNGCSIGDNVILSSGVVIGSEGFGNVLDKKNNWHSIAHLGNVIIGNNVSIGANTTIDRGTIENTEIHDGVKIDNLVHIAHNVIIGKNCAIAANSGIAGSTILGERCMIGGMVGIVGHLKICDDVVVNAKSIVNKDIKNKGVYTGITPLMTHKKWQNVSLWLTKLDKIIKHLNIKLEHLKKKKIC